MKTQSAHRRKALAPKQEKKKSTAGSRFRLVQCEDDEWQAFLEGHQAPLSDHVPLNRALEVVSGLAAICPHASIRIHRNLQA